MVTLARGAPTRALARVGRGRPTQGLQRKCMGTATLWQRVHRTFDRSPCLLVSQACIQPASRMQAALLMRPADKFFLRLA